MKRVVRFAGSTVGSYWFEIATRLKLGLAEHGYDVVVDSHVPDNRNVFTVGTGENDVGVTSIRFLDWAQRRYGPYAGADLREFRLIAALNNPSWIAAAVATETGMTDLAQIAERRHPWRVVLPQPDHAMAIYVDRLLELHGITREKIAEWGGRVFYPLQTGPRAEAPGEPWKMRTVTRELAEQRLVDGSVNYTRWSNAWTRDMTTLLDLRFLRFDLAAVDATIRELGGYRMTLPARMYRGLDEDITTVGWRYDFVYGTVDTPAELIAAILAVLSGESFLENAFGHAYRRGPVSGLPAGLRFHDAVRSAP